MNILLKDYSVHRYGKLVIKIQPSQFPCGGSLKSLLELWIGPQAKFGSLQFLFLITEYQIELPKLGYDYKVKRKSVSCIYHHKSLFNGINEG